MTKKGNVAQVEFYNIDSKAFDRVRHEKLFNILEHLDIDGKDLRVIRNLYWDQSAAVRIGGELSEYKLNKRGVRQ